MGAAWRSPPKKAMAELSQMVTEVKALGLETCLTAGMLDATQAKQLKDAGLDYYNHNIDTSPNFYKKITSTRKFSDRLDTLHNVAQAGIKVCCGGILGLGETQKDRIEFLEALVSLPTPPQSIPINKLIPMKGTPLENMRSIDNFEIVRTIATARIIMPESMIRLTAGRTSMSEELQALCYFAGANSIFIGEKLLTAANPDNNFDKSLFKKLGLEACELS